MSTINQIKLGIILSYLSTVVNMVIQLAYTPIMINILGQSEYGLYTLVSSVVSYLSLFSLGFNGAYLKFYFEYKNKDEYSKIASLNGMFITVFALMATIALVVGIVLSQYTKELFGANLTIEELRIAKLLMQVLVVNIALSFIEGIFNSMISAHEQFIFQRIVNLLGVVCNPLIALPLLLMGYGSVAMVCVITGITIFKVTTSAWFCFSKLKVSCDFKKFDFKLMKSIATFSSFLFLNMIIDQINWSVDKFVLGRVSGTASVAIYGVGAQINSIFITFSTMISNVFAPKVNKIVAANNCDLDSDLTSLFIKVGRIQFIILSAILTTFIFFGKFFITDIFTSSEYELSFYVALILMCPIIIPLIQNMGIEIQRAKNMHQFRSIVYFIMAIINVILSIPLAIYFGPIGSAFGTLIGILVSNGLIMNIYYQKKININIISFWKEIILLSKGLILPLTFGVCISLLVNIDTYITYGVYLFIYVCLFICSMYKFGFNKFEKQTILNILNR